MPELPEGAARHCVTTQDHGLDKALDQELLALSTDALERGEPVRAVVKRRGERWDEMTKQAKEASVMSFAPAQMLLKTGKT